MTSDASIWNNVPKLYAEMLKGKAVTLTIESVTECQIGSDPGNFKPGLAARFRETDKAWEFSAVIIRRQFYNAFGTDDYNETVGKKVVLIPVPLKTAHSDYAIRIDVARTKNANK